jgi:hypothetical protein
MAFPILGQFLQARLVQVLSVVGIHNDLACFVVEGVCKDPIQRLFEIG